MEIPVSRDDLLAKLKTNREQHQAIFDEAVDGYRKEAVKQLNAHVRRIKNGGLQKVYVSLPQPVNHLRDYDAVIGLVEMSKDNTVTLTEDEFRSFVLDDWDWKHAFLGSNAMYSVTASQMADQ